MSTVFIYALTDPVTNIPRYIGKTGNPEERYKNHVNVARDLPTHKRNWINKLKRQNLKPVMEILDEVSTDEWVFWEQYWISQFKVWGFNIVNHTEGGDGLTSANKTAFKKGNPSWNNGTAFTKTCLECGKEYKINPSRAAQSVGCSRQCSVAYRKKNKLYKGVFTKGNSAWNTGLKIKLKPSKHVYQYDARTGLFIQSWDTTMLAGTSLNINVGSIGNCCRNVSKSAGGYIWSYTKTEKIKVVINPKLKILCH